MSQKSALEFQSGNIISANLIGALNRNPQKFRLLQYRVGDQELAPLVLGTYPVDVLTGQPVQLGNPLLGSKQIQLQNFSLTNLPITNALPTVPDNSGNAVTYYSIELGGDTAGTYKYFDRGATEIATFQLSANSRSQSYFGPLGFYDLNEIGGGVHATLTGPAAAKATLHIMYGNAS